MREREENAISPRGSARVITTRSFVFVKTLSFAAQQRKFFFFYGRPLARGPRLLVRKRLPARQFRHQGSRALTKWQFKGDRARAKKVS